MKPLPRLLVVSLALASAGCDKEGADTEKPGADRISALEGMEPEPQTAEEKKAAAKEAAKNLPKVRDRDPEEEKRKMAQSRQRSSQARTMLEQRKFTEAVANARAALKIHEQNVDAMMVLGQVFYREGKYELVVSVTTTALAVDDTARTPKDTSAVYNLQGFALASLGKDQMATQAFKKAAEADDKNAAAWNNLGTRYLRAGDVKTAGSCFSYAIELQPNFAKAHLNHGAALRAQGKLEEAEREIRKAMELERNYPEAHFNLGVLYLDAPQLRDMSTKQRLGVAIQELERYKQLAAGHASTEPLARGLGKRKRIAPVSVERADDYIRLAQKGIEREDRAAKRKAERSASDDEDDDTPQSPGETGDAPATPADDGGDGSPPGPAKPGGAPQAPDDSPQAPAKPGSGPQSPAKPGGSVDQPAAPDGSPQPPANSPGDSPSPKAPAKPGGSPSAPSKPQAPAKPDDAPEPPSKPQAPPDEPDQPAPKQPQQPAPQQPQKPSPQKPGQKSATAGNPLPCDDTKLGRARCTNADPVASRRGTAASSSSGLGFERGRP